MNTRQSIRRQRVIGLLTLCAALLGASAVDGSASGSQVAPPAPAAAAEESTQLATALTHTRFGASVFERSGESYRQAFVRQQQTYGRFGVVRMFFPGLPANWRTIRDRVGQTPVMVSFKAPPRAVIAGDYDARLRQWFATAPTDRPTRWSYWHEPEDDVAAGRLDPRLYRAAWAHLSKLADRVNNRKLRAELILMCWTAERNSRRDWRTYYAGSSAIDVFGFDCYNAGHRAARYREPRELLGPARQVAARAGKPWGVSEFGSVLVRGDLGSGRALWLRQTAAYLRSHGARFGTYFDSNVGVDYRLHDLPSRRAWRAVVQGQ